MGNTWSFVETPKHLQKSSRTKSVIWTYEDFTEDAPDDSKIKRGVKGLQLAIYKHADYYYHYEQARCTAEEVEEILIKTAPSPPNLSTQELAYLLCDTRSRHAAICSYISHMVTKNMDFAGARTDTLLVPCILECMEELQVGDPHIKLSEEDEVAFAQWRAVTAHFLSKGRNAERIQDDTKERIERLVRAMNEILVHFSRSDEDDARRLEGLRAIIVRGKEVGQMIFGSPSRWIFDWNPARKIRAENPRYDDTQTRKLRKFNDSYARRPRFKSGRRVIVRFPALNQHFTHDLDDKHSYESYQSAGDYDASEDVCNAIKDLRRLGITNVHGEGSHPAPSESHLSESSQETLMVQESKSVET